MRKHAKTILCSLLIASFVISSVGTDLPFQSNAIQKNNTPVAAVVYISHDPIIINGSAGYEWSDYPEILGNGSIDNPYTIENFTINAGGVGSGIFIKNTEFNVEIHDCVITNSSTSGDDAGIRIEDSVNISISECLVKVNDYGIRVTSSENITLVDNDFHNSSIVGIFLDASLNITLSENTIFENDGDGIFVNNSIGTMLFDNFVYDVSVGIVVNHSDNSTLLSNIIHGSSKTGMEFTESDFSNITKNRVYNNDENGIYFEQTHFSNLTDNKIYDNNENGVFLQDSHNATIFDNDIYRNRWEGIFLNVSANSTLSSNTIYDVGKGIFLLNSDNSALLINEVYDTKENGIYFESSHFSNVSSNELHDNYGSGVFIDVSHNTTLSLNEMYKNAWAGIFLAASHNSSISINDIHDNGDGISLFNSENSVIVRNNLYENNENGLNLIGSNANTFLHNEMRKNYWDGIYIETSEQNLFTGNRVYDNYRGGVYFDESQDNIFSGNTISDNYLDGILLENSDFNILLGNYINENRRDGISLSNSHNSSITGSVLLENDGFGLFLDAASNDTTIWANNIVNNTIDQAYSLSISNTWDNGTVGNYWSNFITKYPAAQQAGLFWDTPYEIDVVGSLDNFPLFQPILPEVPVLITTTRTVDKAHLLLEWEIVNCAEIYDIYVDGVVFETTAEISENLMLDVNGVYEIEVVAVNIFGESLPSTPISITVEIAPEVPDSYRFYPEITGLFFIIIGITRSYENVTIKWDASKNVDVYNIYIDDTLSTNTSKNFVILQMEVNGEYNITITAVNSVGESLPSEVITVIINITPVYGYFLSVFGILGLIGGIVINNKWKEKAT